MRLVQKYVVLETARLTPLKEIDDAVRRDKKYRQIAASIEHVGIIEPLVVFAGDRGKYLVLDGHKRLDILKAHGVTEVACLLATDDESYTYNKRVNYLSPIGEHHMILKNLENGVTEEEIAAALDVNVATIRAKRNLLDGICSEAAETLKDKRVGNDAFSVLRKMKALRQTEVAGLMVAANNYTRRFALALLTGTRTELLAATARVRPAKGAAATQKAMLEQETDALLREYKAVDESYGTEVLSSAFPVAILSGCSPMRGSSAISQNATRTSCNSFSSWSPMLRATKLTYRDYRRRKMHRKHSSVP